MSPDVLAIGNVAINHHVVAMQFGFLGGDFGGIASFFGASLDGIPEGHYSIIIYQWMQCNAMEEDINYDSKSRE